MHTNALSLPLLAVLATASAVDAVHAATLQSDTAWQQVYWVRPTNPAQPGYPAYPLLIDGWDERQAGETGPLDAFLGDAALRVNAQARTDVGEHHVQATLIGRNRNLAPVLSLPPAGSAPVSIYTPALVRDWLQQATALSRVTDTFTANTTAQAQANLYAASRLRVQLGLSDALSSWYGPGGPGYGDINVYSSLSYSLFDVTPGPHGASNRQFAGSLSVVSALQVSGLKLIDTTVVNQFSDRFFTYDAFIQHSDTVLRDGTVVSQVVDGAGGFPRVMDDSGIGLEHATAGNHSVAFNVLAGHRYEIETSFFCSVTLGGLTAFLQGTNAFCDGGQSAYWNGLSQVTDANGQPLEHLDVVADSGFNYRWANPLSPSPDAVLPPSPVPEPGSWALLAAGLALVASRARAARGTGAAPQA